MNDALTDGECSLFNCMFCFYAGGNKMAKPSVSVTHDPNIYKSNTGSPISSKSKQPPAPASPVLSKKQNTSLPAETEKKLPNPITTTSQPLNPRGTNKSEMDWIGLTSKKPKSSLQSAPWLQKSPKSVGKEIENPKPPGVTANPKPPRMTWLEQVSGKSATPAKSDSQLASKTNPTDRTTDFKGISQLQKTPGHDPAQSQSNNKNAGKEEKLDDKSKTIEMPKAAPGGQSVIGTPHKEGLKSEGEHKTGTGVSKTSTTTAVSSGKSPTSRLCFGNPSSNSASILISSAITTS